MTSRVVPVSAQNEEAPNLDDRGLKSHAKVIAILQLLLEISTKKSSVAAKDYAFNCQDRVQSCRELELPSSPADDSELRKPCPDYSYSPTDNFRSRKTYGDLVSSPSRSHLLLEACPDSAGPVLFISPPSPTHDSQLRKAYRDSPNRLSRVLEESESFDKREVILIAPQIGDPFDYNSMPATPSTPSEESADEKRMSEQGNRSPELAVSARKTMKLSDLSSYVLYPMKKIRDAYVNCCMMSIEGTGNFTFMVQGGPIASTASPFSELPLSKTDAKNYG